MDTTDNAHARTLLERREARHGIFEAGEHEILADLVARPERALFDLAHRVEIAPHVTLLAAVRAVHPLFPVGHSDSVPSYRRWACVPTPWLVLRALEYALDPRPVERVRADELRDGDILVIGTARFLVSGPSTWNNTTSYSFAKLDDPRAVSHREGGMGDVVEREVRTIVEPPAGVNWPVETTPADVPHSRGNPVVYVEVHGSHLDEREDAAARFVAGQMPGVRVAGVGDTVSAPPRFCRHGDRLTPVAYESAAPRRAAVEKATAPTRRAARCEEFARRGTGFGACDRPLDSSGYCDRASDHVDSATVGV